MEAGAGLPYWCGARLVYERQYRVGPKTFKASVQWGDCCGVIAASLEQAAVYIILRIAVPAVRSRGVQCVRHDAGRFEAHGGTVRYVQGLEPLTSWLVC